MAASDQSAEIHVGYIANLVNIEYPGCIKNPEKALQTLGGLKKLKEMIQSPDTRLPLKFRPDDIYCKPAYATIFSTNNVVLNVKQKRNKKTGAVKMFVTLTGIIEKTYKFTTMMDYQYLTMEKNGDECKPLGGLVTITDLELTSWLTNGAPLHFMPQIFSPLDVPYAYHFKEEDNKKSAELQQGSLFATARKKRFSYNQLVTYDDENVPTEPSAGAESKIVTQYLKEKLAEVKKLFAERPIWTRAAITCVTRLNSNRLKTILPCVGYNSISGPWRTMWIRHGYDPRKNVGAKHYQLIDYRYRQRDKADMEKNIVLHKRSYSKYFSSITRAKPKQSKSDQLELINKPGADYDGDKMTEEQRLQQYKLWPGMVPPYRQIFYQIIDIELPEVQAIVNSNEGREGPCSKTNGFLVENAHNRIRAVINKNVTAAMEELMGEGEGTSAEVTEAEEDYEDDDEAYPEAEQSMADGDAYTGEGDGYMVDDSYNEQEILNSYR